MIPNAETCKNYGEFGCPNLFDDLEALLSVVLQQTRDSLPAGLGEKLEGYVGLMPMAVDNGDVVICFPVDVKAVRSKKNPQMVRTEVTAQATVVFSGWPGVMVEGGNFTVPDAAEVHEATRFVTSIAWCVWCQVMNEIASGKLLTGVDLPGFDGTSVSMDIEDFGGMQAGFDLTVKWVV